MMMLNLTNLGRTTRRRNLVSVFHRDSECYSKRGIDRENQSNFLIPGHANPQAFKSLSLKTGS